ncbi:hypothetical protein MTR67_019041 [Solanum verrucosum]|uniref:Tf2-1-like SH3-like domain-containing protein n=1 Tax=Solanum verrucosum TaxID=315347 RepID=A0AAF0TMX8_SOLVR|nr:hypothetical protein MTR67_019041 [Solanum verrucosum]
MDPFEALYGRRCRSPIGWFEVGEVALIKLELVHEAMEKVRLIRERLRTTQSRQKSYADVRRRHFDFDVIDWILRHLRKVVYELELPNDLASVHPVFHVSMLKKCVGDTTSIVPLEVFRVKENISFEKVSVEILDRQVKKLRNKEVASVKVLWRNPLVEGATWEADMMSGYPHLFPFTPTLA